MKSGKRQPLWWEWSIWGGEEHSTQREQQCRSPARWSKCIWRREEGLSGQAGAVGEVTSEGRARLAGPCSFYSE